MSSTLMDQATLQTLTKDIRKASATMGAGEARTLVDLYYQLQEFRLQAHNQTLSLTKTEDPHETVQFFRNQFYSLEKDLAKALDTYSGSQPLGEWARLHVGVGPVIAAGLLAHTRVERFFPHPSALWKFAGLAPGQRYVKGQKRDWNARLKVLCWKLSDSFVKQSGRENCYYGHLYLQRKEMEVARNISGGNAEAAKRELELKRIQDPDLRARLTAGMLSDQQIDRRARRYAAKRFLAHFWEAAWRLEFGTEAPRAYVYEHMGHGHVEPCPIPMPPLLPKP